MRFSIAGVVAEEISYNSRQANFLYVEEGVHAMSLHAVQAIGAGVQMIKSN